MLTTARTDFRAYCRYLTTTACREHSVSAENSYGGILRKQSRLPRENSDAHRFFLQIPILPEKSLSPMKVSYVADLRAMKTNSTSVREVNCRLCGMHRGTAQMMR